MSKLELGEIKEQLAAQEEKAKQSESTLLQAIKSMNENMKSMGDTITNTIKADNQTRFDDLTAQVVEIKSKQDEEANARIDIENKVNNLQKNQAEMADKLEQVQAVAQPDIAELAMQLLPLLVDKLAPEVKTSLAKEINLNTAHANASYCQTLVSEIKQHETGLMLYGFKPEDGSNLENEIRTKLFKTHMDLDIGNFRIFKFESKDANKPPSFRITLGSSDIRNSILSRGKRLPRGTRVEKRLC